MMTLVDDTQIGFSADLGGVRDRVQTPEEPVQQSRITPKVGRKLTWAEPQNCTLHFVAPDHEVRPSFATIVGLSLCPDCVLRVADVVVEEGLSQKELIELALTGAWL